MDWIVVDYSSAQSSIYGLNLVTGRDRPRPSKRLLECRPLAHHVRFWNWGLRGYCADCREVCGCNLLRLAFHRPAQQLRSAPRKLIRACVCYVGGSTSPAPPQTSQRRWPVPLHSLQMPIVMPTRDFLPVPRHATQEVVLWPWHLGHNVFVGISPPVLGIYLRCIAPAAWRC